MSGVRSKFIDVIKEAEAADYLYNESGDSSVIFDTLNEMLEKPNFLFPRKEFLLDCLWISIVMMAPFAGNIIIFDQIFPFLHPELFHQSQRRTKFDTSQQGATVMPLIPYRPVQGTILYVMLTKQASKY